MENQTLPLISIITVTLNSKKLLNNTIYSVIEQAYPFIEFIIIDGGSSDGTLSLLKENERHISCYISENDDGIYDAMNKGLSLANGKYIQFLNAGEFFCKKESLLEMLSLGEPDCDIIYGDILLLDEARNINRHHKAMDFSLENLKRYGTGVLCHQAILVKTAIVSKYDCRYKYKSELNWYFDIIEKNPKLSIFHYQKPFVGYSLGGIGYQKFIQNRLEWYKLLIRRYGYSSVFNRKFIKFIFQDFQNRYSLLRKIVDCQKKTLNNLKYYKI